jgi:hypothetical protein
MTGGATFATSLHAICSRRVRGDQERKAILKRLIVRLGCFAALVTMTSCAASSGQAQMQSQVQISSHSPGNQISVSYFYDNLSPYGEWFQDPRYGWCWTPYDVSAEWRPYSDGRWEYSDYGWSWASAEPWGWASYHYGRWFFDDSYGWAWVPGTEWAPAWVAWRYGDNYIGWAPLPPSAGWNASAGLGFSDFGGIQSSQWCFVPNDRVFDVNIRIQVISVARNVTMIERSHDATHYESRNGRPANFGPDVAQIESHLGRNVPRVQIADTDSPSRGDGHSAGKGTVEFYRPVVQLGPAAETPSTEATDRRSAMSEQSLQRQRDDQRKKLENDLNNERARLAQDQQKELQGRAAGPEADQVRKQHAVEQQAFDAHATKQRQVLDQRMQKQIVKPDKSATAKADTQGKGKSKPKQKDKGKDGEPGGGN